MVLGLLATLGAGIALGLFGGGGSLLIVPTLVYLLGLSPTDATTHSLIVVGGASLAGALLHGGARLDTRLALRFAVPSVATAFAVRAFVVPRLPEVVTLGTAAWALDDVLMLTFAALVAGSGLAMLRGRCCEEARSPAPRVAPVAGAATGAVTAVLGAGGGFLIVPALVLLLGVPMGRAVAASLLIIAMQAIAGAAGAAWSQFSVDVTLAAELLAVMIAGVAVGTAGANRMAPALLRRTFGWLVLAVAGAMAVTELL